MEHKVVLRKNDIVTIEKNGITIGPIINRKHRQYKFYSVNSGQDEQIQTYFSKKGLSKKGIDKLSINYSEFIKDFEIKSICIDLYKTKMMTDDDIEMDFDNMANEIEMIRYRIDNSSNNGEITYLQYLFLTEPHKIFGFDSNKDYKDYLDYVDKIIESRRKKDMNRVSSAINNIKW